MLSRYNVYANKAYYSSNIVLNKTLINIIIKTWKFTAKYIYNMDVHNWYSTIILVFYNLIFKML
jgi:hypothetical protein